MLNAELTLSGPALVDPASQAFQKVLARHFFAADIGFFAFFL